MSQSGRAELLLDVTRQLARVTEQETGHEGAFGRRQVASPGQTPGAESVGRPLQRPAGGLEREQLDGVEARNRVPPPESLVVAGEGLQPTRHRHLLPRLEAPQLAGGGT